MLHRCVADSSLKLMECLNLSHLKSQWNEILAPFLFQKIEFKLWSGAQNNFSIRLSRLFRGFTRWKKSSDDGLYSNTSSLYDVESLQLAVEGGGSFYLIVQRYWVGTWKRETWRRKMRKTICDLRISIRKQGNRLKLVNYKSDMQSM